LSLYAADVTGKWSGTIELKKDGETKSESAFLILKQEGTALNGSAGAREDHQFPMRNGKVEGDKLTFEVPQGEYGERVMHFSLTATEDSIEGEVSGPDKNGKPDSARLALKRVKEG